MLVLQSQIEHLRVAGFDESFGVVTVPLWLLSKKVQVINVVQPIRIIDHDCFVFNIC